MVSDNEFSYRITKVTCLNPCCNGIWSQTYIMCAFLKNAVLILVVMEYGLRLKTKFESVVGHPDVLILVVMEYGLRR